MLAQHYCICLLLILFITCFFSLILILILVNNSAQIFKSSKSYYSIVTLIIASKLIIYLIYGLRFSINFSDSSSILPQNFYQIYQYLLYVTDCGYMILLTIICQRYIVFCCNTVVNKINQRLSNFIIFSEIVIVAASVAMILLNAIMQNKEIVPFICAGINFYSVFCIIVTQFYMNIKFTGTLVQEDHEICLRLLKKVQFSFFISRSVQGIYLILIGTSVPYFQFMTLQFTNNSETKLIFLNAILYIVIFFITQWVPLIVTVNNFAINMLSQIETKNKKNSIIQTEQSGYIKIIEGSQIQQNSLQLTIKQFTIQSTISSNTNGFGKVLKGKLKGNYFAIREIDIQLSKYLIEQIVKQIEYKKMNKINSLVNIKLSFVEENRIYLISQYIKNNLNDYLSANKNISIIDKMKICYKIAVAIEDIHKINLPHGSLCFNNIFVQNSLIKISDHGMLSLKKFINLTKGYSNKSFYTAPEFFSERSGIVSKPTKEGDIYSFGMIMFELFTEIFDYRSLSIKEIQKSFKQKQIRPKIPENLPNNISNLIRNCWQPLISQRPSIQHIKSILKQYHKGS